MIVVLIVLKTPGRKCVQCALCRNKECLIGKNCSVIKSGLDYSGDNLKSIQVSAWLESDSAKRTKLEEIAIYSKRLGYRKIGIAFCVEHEREARLVYDILSRYFEVFSVCCKVCSIEKESLDIRKTGDLEFEAACNSIGQALLLNDDRTDLNIMLGLKTGYDILFAKYSEAPSITLSLLELPCLGDSEIDFIE
jgi:uncharacterized metal-binding protein